MWEREREGETQADKHGESKTVVQTDRQTDKETQRQTKPFFVNLPQSVTLGVSSDEIMLSVDSLDLATRGVMVSTSAFLACHQCCWAGSSLACSLNFRALVCDIF